jgi:hypothetical protein
MPVASRTDRADSVPPNQRPTRVHLAALGDPGFASNPRSCPLIGGPDASTPRPSQNFLANLAQRRSRDDNPAQERSQHHPPPVRAFPMAGRPADLIAQPSAVAIADNRVCSGGP